MQTISNGEDGADVRAKLNNNWPFRGDWAGTTTLPTTGGSGASGAVNVGDMWRLTNELTISSGGDDYIYSPGTIILACANSPGQTKSSWLFLAVQL